ncbi:MAG: sigma-70 family RNA polymerase sigma factor [Lentisphaeria bacterium]
MKLYMQEVGYIPLIPQEEEADLAERIAAGDREARQKLIKGNLRLVVKIAHDFRGLGLPLVDLISEGNIGLMRAAEKFSPDRGAKFSSYAAWWIKQSMRRALSNQSRTIRIPVQSAGRMNKIRKTYDELYEKLKREPTDAEIADALHYNERTVRDLRTSDIRSLSVHSSLKDSDGNELGDLIADSGTDTPEEIIIRSDSFEYLSDLMTVLTERERYIITKRFGLNGEEVLTLKELSVAIGRTRERVRQLQFQALEKLKDKLAEEMNRD